MSNKFDVYVSVTKPEPSNLNTYLIAVEPEQIFLDGREDSAIVLTMRPDSMAQFTSTADMHFQTEGGRARFPDMTFEPPDLPLHRGRITAKTSGPEMDRTVYTYFVDSHLLEHDIIVRVDPEADNPPPPPSGP
jgi:hypothetical protein